MAKGGSETAVEGLEGQPAGYRRDADRYADDFVVVHGEQADAERIREDIAEVLAPMGLDLSEAKTSITHIDEGFDFLGYRIQRHQKRGTNKRFGYTYPSKAALAVIKRKAKQMGRTGRNRPLQDLLRRLNLVLRGWTNYFRHGASKVTFGYLRAYVWHRVVRWLRRKHPRANWKQLRRRYLPGWWPTDGDMVLFDPNRVPVRYYRYRGTTIPSPWPSELNHQRRSATARSRGEPDAWERARPVRGRAEGPAEGPAPRLGPTRPYPRDLALQAGIHPKVISERLGHANVGITLDTYSHAIPAMQEEAADQIAALVFDQ